MKNRISVLGRLLAMLVLIMMLSGCGATDGVIKDAIAAMTGVEAEEQGFSCYAVDKRGEKIKGYRREADGVWYMFLPADQSVSDLVLHYTGEVVETSAGIIDKESSTILGGFVTNGDKIKLATEDGMTYTVIVKVSGLPSVQIYLRDATLDDIHADKSQKHRGNTFVLTDPTGTYDLTASNSVEIKGRGNSTWTLYEKKAYQVKFTLETSVLGMSKAKKWVLLANSSDDSMLRSQLVYRMADKLNMAFVPQFEYVDLWVDGEYLGTYMLGEKVEIGTSRLSLTQPDAAMFEHDENFYEEEEYWFLSEILQRHFSLKDIATEEAPIMTNAMNAFSSSLGGFITYLYSTPSDQVTPEALAQKIDVDSFVKYYLINEYVLNRESYATSFYWYQDGPKDVLHLGPIWDFDTCMGNDGAGFEESYGEKHVMFRYLLAMPAFRERAEELYAEYKDELHAMTEDVDVLTEQIRCSAEMNYLRWDVLGTENGKKDAANFAGSFEEAAQNVKNWLKGREEGFQIADCEVATSQISADCRTMEIRYDDGKDHGEITFAVWNDNDDPDDAKWYQAKQTDGVWYSTIDLTAFNEAGMYRYNVYADDEEDAIANGRNYVTTAVAPDHVLDVQLAEDQSHTVITLYENVPCRQVYFALWSDEGGQDDIQWFAASHMEGEPWTTVVDMTEYGDGVYHIHAYELADDPPTLLGTHILKVKSPK